MCVQSAAPLPPPAPPVAPPALRRHYSSEEKYNQKSRPQNFEIGWESPGLPKMNCESLAPNVGAYLRAYNYEHFRAKENLSMRCSEISAVFEIRVLFCTPAACKVLKNGASGHMIMCFSLYKPIQKLGKACTHRVHRFQNLCTRQPKCARRVQGATLISCKCGTNSRSPGLTFLWKNVRNSSWLSVSFIAPPPPQRFLGARGLG